MGQCMNRIQFYKNRKVYVSFIGMLAAAMIYFKMNIDFSFYSVDYGMDAFLDLCLIFAVNDIKLWTAVFLLRKLKYRLFFQLLLLFCLGYLFGAAIVISLMYQTTIMIPKIAFCIVTFFYINHLYEREWSRSHGLLYLFLFIINVFLQVILKIIF